jgi:hypothetical protein
VYDLNNISELFLIKLMGPSLLKEKNANQKRLID